MSYQRREFLKLTGGLTSAIAFSSIAGKLDLSEIFLEERKKMKTFGLQLYSVRDVIPKDPKGVLKQIASFGYKQIEGYEHKDLGIFWGMSNTDFKKYMDDLGMNFFSSHCDTTKDFDKKAAEAAAIGMKYLIFPYEAGNKSIDEYIKVAMIDDYKKLADQFNAKGEICRKNGIKFAFHNHSPSFVPIKGEFPQDVLMKNTDPSLVDFEMDIYWVVTAGQDPIAWLKKYPNRFHLCHVKDRTKGATVTADTCTLGEGSIDYPSLLKQTKKLGMQYYIVEQEKYADTTPLDSAKADAEYMKKIRI